MARKTLERYREIVELHLVPALGAIPLAKLQPVHVQAYYAAALASGRRDGTGGLSAQTVVHHDRVLNVALKRARSLRLIPSNPVEDVSRPAVNRHEIEVLEPAESAALLAAARTTRMFPIVFLALATGLRRGEVLGLRWSDVDLERRSLTVAQSLEQTKRRAAVQGTEDKAQPAHDRPVAVTGGGVAGAPCAAGGRSTRARHGPGSGGSGVHADRR